MLVNKWGRYTSRIEQVLTFWESEVFSSVRSATLMSSEQVPRGMSVTAVTDIVDSASLVGSVDVAFRIWLVLVALFDELNNALTDDDVTSAGGFSKCWDIAGYILLENNYFIIGLHILMFLSFYTCIHTALFHKIKARHIFNEYNS